jgi:hypothetical protein
MREEEKAPVMNVELPFEADEYNYYATALIFGKRSPKIKNFSAYTFDIFRKKSGLVFSEHSGLNTKNHLEVIRNLQISNTRLLQTSHTDMRSEINGVVTYIDHDLNFNLSDAIFTDEEFEYYKHNWNETVINKIRSFGMLIRVLNERKISDVPLLINEYLNITKTLLDRMEFWFIK